MLKKICLLSLCAITHMFAATELTGVNQNNQSTQGVVDEVVVKKPKIYSRSFSKDWLTAEYGETDHDNRGEFIYWGGAQNFLKKYEFCSLNDLKAGDIYMIVVSNVIRPSYSYCLLAPQSDIQYCVNNGIKIIVLSCGAQSNLNGDMIRTNDDIIQQFNKIKETLPGNLHLPISIAVRGKYTQSVLSSYGINSVVLGCPSILNDFPKSQNFSRNSNLRLAYAATPGGFFGHQLIFILGHLYRGTYIAQSINETNEKSPDEGTPYYLRNIKKWNEMSFSNFKENFDNSYFQEKMKKHGVKNVLQFHEIEEHLKTHSFLPKSFNGWIEKLKEFDLFIGSRIHGTIAALIAGCRALCIAHDSRTLELCQTLNIPYVTEFSIPENLEKFYEMADPSDFFRTLPEKRENYRSFLRSHGLNFV